MKKIRDLKEANRLADELFVLIRRFIAPKDVKKVA